MIEKLSKPIGILSISDLNESIEKINQLIDLIDIQQADINSLKEAVNKLAKRRCANPLCIHCG